MPNLPCLLNSNVLCIAALTRIIMNIIKPTTRICPSGLWSLPIPLVLANLCSKRLSTDALPPSTPDALRVPPSKIEQLMLRKM